MNIYDFDKTIYDGDSTLDFYVFCLKKQPFLILYLPFQILSFILFLLKKKDKLIFKQDFYGFLKWVVNPESKVELFWDKNQHKIKKWYLSKRKQEDLIISASPEFLLRPICERLNNLNLIASKVDIYTGKCLGENCYGDEKVKRLFYEYPNITVSEFYSDSLSDAPMSKISNKSFFVNKDLIVEWGNYKDIQKKSVFLNKEFLMFILVGSVNAFNGILFSFLFSLVFKNVSAFILGYSVSLVISYLLNSHFVFKDSFSFIKFIKFIFSYIPNFLIQFILVVFLLKTLGVHQLIVYSISAAIGVPITFIILKIFTFK